MNEIRVYFLTFSVVSSIWRPNLRPFPLTFKRDKMNIVTNIYENFPPKPNLGLILISIKICVNIHKYLMSFSFKLIKPIA